MIFMHSIRKIPEKAWYLSASFNCVFIVLLMSIGSMLVSIDSEAADSPQYLYDNEALTVRSLDNHAQIIDTKTGEVIADHVLGTRRLDDEVLVYTGDNRDTPYTAKKGVLSSDGQWILAPEYDGIDLRRDSGAFIVEREGKHGVFGLDGKQRTPIEYDRLPDLFSSNDQWIAKREGKAGVINPHSGDVIVPTEYDDIELWEGLALASTFEPDRDHGRTTVYDSDGSIVANLDQVSDVRIWREPKLLVVNQRVLDPFSGEDISLSGRYDEINPIYGSDAAIVKLGDKMGLIGADGSERIAPTYALIYPLNEDKQAEIYLRVAPDTWPDGGNGKVGVADTDGHEIVSAEWDGLDLITVKRWEGDPTRHFFYVRKNQHFGSIDTNGDTILPANFDSARRLSNSGQIYRVTRDNKTGMCSLLSGECPVEPSFDSVNVFEDSYRQMLFEVTKNGRHGLITQSGETLIPVEAGAIRKVSTDVKAASIRAAVVDDKGLHGKMLEYNENTTQWHLSPVELSTEDALRGGAYDGQFNAHHDQPIITARYLPADYLNAEAIVSGVRDGDLRQLVYPSLQLSSDDKAYAFFNTFKGMDQPLNGALPVCPTEDGFDILLISPRYASANCALFDSDKRLHFTRESDDSLHCEACAAKGIPTEWTKRGSEPEVPDHCETAFEDSPGIDQLYKDWRQRFSSNVSDLKKAFEENNNRIDDADFSRIMRASIDMETRAPHNVARGLMKSAGHLDSPVAPDLETLLATFAQAEPAGYGGLFPETQSQYQKKCQQVWYLRLPELEDAIANGDDRPAGLNYALPNDGTFERGVYPYALFAKSGDHLRLTGISRDLAVAMQWIKETGHDASRADTPTSVREDVPSSP
ncbi:WG repeat-containing protein [Kushneria sp. Sum13]|uniref:WG repeat-containing protein n=1 Tax=Kushneria sp. Sum13 TaxID=3459196 RepID=UPI0040465A91